MKKLFFKLTSDWHGHATESMWVEEIGDMKFEIRNVPFYVMGIGFNDIVQAHVDDDGFLFFNKVVTRSGHSTYRIIVLKEEMFAQYWRRLHDLGCSYEKGEGHLYAIDVPPETDIHHAYAQLEQGEKDLVWGFEEGHCGHLTKPNT